METLDAPMNLWNFDGPTGLQQGTNNWEPTLLDEYPDVKPDYGSDSDSSLESATNGLFFNPVNVETPSGPVGAVYGAKLEGAGFIESTYHWACDANGQMMEVTSPESATTDYEGAVAQGGYLMHGDSSDETSQAYDEDLSCEDSEESYSTSTTMSSASNSASQSPNQNSAVSATGRPVRGHPQRTDALRQVQDMIRQVNSAVEPAVKAVKVKGGSNSKKRARVEPDIRSVTLTREQLLTMTSEELDEFTARLKADHPLTTHEMREIKRQRRLIKNREYAQASRVKKKTVLSDLGVKFHDIEQERAQLIQRVNLLEAENSSLRAQLNLPASSLPPLPFMNNLSSSTSTKHNHSNNAKYLSLDSEAVEMSPPRAKRTRSGRSTAAAIGGGLSLFAMVLLALAVYSGTHTSLPFNLGGSPNSQSSTQNPPVSSSAMNFQPTDAYSTFRTMDILATPHAEAHVSDDPDPDLHASLSHPIDSASTLAHSTSFTSTIATMDDLMAHEEMVFSSTNASFLHDEGIAVANQ